jgi:hypothetical protein
MRAAAFVLALTIATFAGAELAAADCSLALKDPAAHQHCDAGATAYAAGEFGTAASEFAAAYQLEPEPGLLFAWAQARRLGGSCPEALDLYHRYLDTKPNEAQTTATQGWIAECEKAAGITHVEPPPPPPPPHDDDHVVVPPPIDPPTGPEAPPAAASRWRDPLGITLAAGGVIGLGVGGGFLYAAKLAEDRDESVLEDQKAAWADADRRRTIGFIALGAGAALAVGAVIRFATHDPAPRGEHTTVVIDPSGSVFVLGSF